MSIISFKPKSTNDCFVRKDAETASLVSMQQRTEEIQVLKQEAKRLEEDHLNLLSSIHDSKTSSQKQDYYFKFLQQQKLASFYHEGLIKKEQECSSLADHNRKLENQVRETKHDMKTLYKEIKVFTKIHKNCQITKHSKTSKFLNMDFEGNLKDFSHFVLGNISKIEETVTALEKKVTDAQTKLGKFTKLRNKTSKNQLEKPALQVESYEIANIFNQYLQFKNTRKIENSINQLRSSIEELLIKKKLTIEKTSPICILQTNKNERYLNIDHLKPLNIESSFDYSYIFSSFDAKSKEFEEVFLRNTDSILQKIQNFSVVLENHKRNSSGSRKLHERCKELEKELDSRKEERKRAVQILQKLETNQLELTQAQSTIKDLKNTNNLLTEDKYKLEQELKSSQKHSQTTKLKAEVSKLSRDLRNAKDEKLRIEKTHQQQISLLQNDLSNLKQKYYKLLDNKENII